MSYRNAAKSSVTFESCLPTELVFEYLVLFKLCNELIILMANLQLKL